MANVDIQIGDTVRWDQTKSQFPTHNRKGDIINPTDTDGKVIALDEWILVQWDDTLSNTYNLDGHDLILINQSNPSIDQLTW